MKENHVYKKKNLLQAVSFLKLTEYSPQRVHSHSSNPHAKKITIGMSVSHVTMDP